MTAPNPNEPVQDRCPDCGSPDHEWQQCPSNEPEGRRIVTSDERLTVARAILSEWAEKRGHALCWNHPEILQRLCHVLNVSIPTVPAPPVEEQIPSCVEYWNFVNGGAKFDARVE